MTAVPDLVLNWLYNSLKIEYHDVDRTYQDVAQTLSQYPSLSPRTEVYTYENGTPALLVQLRGTLPVRFRGATYRFPISIWVPHSYPRESPMAYITPSQDIAVRPGQHVSAEGRVYHPYLAHWGNHWDKSTIVDFLKILQEIFAKEPPVITRQQQEQRIPSVEHATSPPPVPPPPEGMRRLRRTSSSQQPSAPPPPPKPLEAQHPGSPPTSEGSTLPPLPPKPGASTDSRGAQFPNRQVMSSDQAPLYATPQKTTRAQHQPLMPQGFVPAITPPFYIPGPGQKPQMPPWSTQASAPPHSPRAPYSTNGYSGPSMYTQPPYSIRMGTPSQQDSRKIQAAVARAPKPIQDLLSTPLDASMSAQTLSDTAASAPPIPPNPEKDAVLHAISVVLREQLNQTVAQNTSALPALEAQHAALQQAFQRMQSEMQQLRELDGMLTSNEKILREAMQEADRVIESVGRREVPAVDDVLVAPTVVGEQLYGLVADERGIADAIFAMSRALDKGRVSGDVFIRQTRSLAREQFLKKALIRKIADGMGLATQMHR